MPELTAAQHRTMFAKFVAAVNRISGVDPQIAMVGKSGESLTPAERMPGALLEAFFNDPFQGTFSLSTVSQDTILEAGRHRLGVHDNQVSFVWSIAHTGL
jgi:hypothetical protein